jgi:large subunit ribosomal protein L20
MRVTNSPASRKRRNRMLQAAKGFRLKRSKLYRYASDAVDHGRQYAYRDRRRKKRTFRYLWQARINAATRAAGMTYSRFIEGLKAAKCELDRKVLADIAAQDNATFLQLVKLAQDSLKTKATAAKAGADDLVQIEGVGPKINELLKAQGITTFAKLAATPVAQLKEILAAGGPRFKMWDPTTWPEQAALAAKGEWDAFEKLKKELDGGRRV